MLQGQQRTLPHWINDIHAQQTISMGFSKYRRSHTVISLYWWMKQVFLFQRILKTKTTEIRLSPCVHITFCSHFSLFTNVNFIRHRRMLLHLCPFRVLWFPLKKSKNVFVSYCFWHSSAAHIFETNWPISMGFSAKCIAVKMNNNVYN